MERLEMLDGGAEFLKRAGQVFDAGICRLPANAICPTLSTDLSTDLWKFPWLVCQSTIRSQGSLANRYFHSMAVFHDIRKYGSRIIETCTNGIRSLC